MKPWVKVSTCPVGKYRDTSRYSSKGWNAFFTVYQDPQGWLGEGIQDQIYPMMYFRGNGFYPFALDWQEQSNGRHIVPGLGIYFLHPDEGNWTSEEVERPDTFHPRQPLGRRSALSGKVPDGQYPGSIRHPPGAVLSISGTATAHAVDRQRGSYRTVGAKCSFHRRRIYPAQLESCHR